MTLELKFHSADVTLGVSALVAVQRFVGCQNDLATVEVAWIRLVVTGDVVTKQVFLFELGVAKGTTETSLSMSQFV